MKKNKLKIGLLLLITALFISCSKNTINTSVTIETEKSFSASKIKFGKFQNDYTPEITDQGIIFSFPQSHSGYYKLKLGNFSTDVFLEPGDSIHLSPDFLNSENKSFTGNGILLSNYILSDVPFTEFLYKNINFDSIYSLPPKEFCRSIDSVFNFKKHRLKRFIKEKNISNELFIKTENNRILYESSIKKNRYYRDHKFLTGEKTVLKNDFDAYLTQVDFNDSTLLHLEAYREFLFTYFERVGLEEKDKNNNPVSFTEHGLSKVLEILTDNASKSYALYRIMDIHLNETPVNKLGNLIDRFNQNCSNKKYKKKINTYYSRLEKLKSGNKAPEFTMPDINGKSVSLSDFKGKLVYIDIWNSFCSPCLKEVPVLEDLRKKYNGQNIVFIGISYDSDQELWKKTMKRKNIKGIQLFANGWNHQFGKDYLVYSNPRFILIDPNGNFIDAKAPKPSENIDDLISEYIK